MNGKYTDNDDIIAFDKLNHIANTNSLTKDNCRKLIKYNFYKMINYFEQSWLSSKLLYFNRQTCKKHMWSK